jgi:L-cystine transport system ATP-binding protein
MPLAAESLTKRFGSCVALDNVSCVVMPGTITVVVGPSGSGKSTLLRALSLIDPPDSGVVTIDNRTYRYPVEDGDAFVSPWPRVTVVFQQLFLWPHMTLRENLMLPARHLGIRDSAAKLARLIDTFGMHDFIDRYPNQTSIGQRQRAAIGRALILEPAHLLLDEVTSSLDVESIAAIVDHLQVLREEGLGIFVITHSLAFARRSADQVLFLDEGRVIASGDGRMLEASEHPRVRRFIQLLETTR